jgi:EpsD family peptidyl-prolyl cis-trans isomerase
MSAIANGKTSPEASRKALDALVDRQLLVQKALEMKLDRNPTVLQDIENAKNEVLARAYLNSKVADVGFVDSKEVTAYYFDHPELFSERRVYQLRILVIPHELLTQELRDLMDHAASLDQIAEWLKQKGAAFADNVGKKAAEELDFDLSKRLAAMGQGQLFILESGKAAQLSQILSFEVKPVSERDAKPLIERFLTNQRRQQRTNSEVALLHTGAKIEILDKNLQQLSVPPAEPTANPGADKKADDDYVKKGITGLK